jgi:hypothetical protein
MSTKTVYGIADTFSNQDQPGQNYGTATRLMLKGQTSHKKYGYIHLARPFPLGALIEDATLTVTLAGAWPGSTTITVRRVTASWAESRLTWNNQPATTATHEATVVVSGGAKDDEVAVDITDMMADVAAGSAWYGIRIEVSVNGPVYLWASEANGRPAPNLALTWSLSPDAATDLHPLDAVVGSTTPTVTWTFRDVDGTSDQASSRVQVDTTDDFASPVYDSTMIANGEQQWMIPSGLSNGGDYFWRVMVTDTNGNVSEWSDTGAFHVTVKGALTISSPTTTPEETTPPITWSLASGTQIAYRVILVDNLADPLSLAGPTVIYDTGRVASAATTIPLPAGLMTEVDAARYTLTVMVWDDTDRESTPGLPAYSEASKTMTLTPSGTPADVNTIVVTDDAPAVHIVWTRTAQPDYFLLRVDGVVPVGVDAFGNTWDRLDPADYFVSGTTYALDWFRSAPGVAHVYEVIAVLLDTGKLRMSTNGPTAAFTSRPVGLWLVDEATDTRVRFEGRDDPAGQWKIGEESADFYPVGRRAPVHIVTSLRGYEGSMGGLFLNDWEGTTAAEWKDALESLKASGSTAIRLIVQGFNIPVQVTDIEAAPSHPAGYSAGFTFAQTDEFFAIGTPA